MTAAGSDHQIRAWNMDGTGEVKADRPRRYGGPVAREGSGRGRVLMIRDRDAFRCEDCAKKLRGIHHESTTNRLEFVPGHVGDGGDRIHDPCRRP